MEKLGKVLAWIGIVFLLGVIIYAAFFSDEPFLDAIAKIFGKLLTLLKRAT